MNRRNFIRKMLGAGAALYVPTKTYGFLFPDKCGAWRKGGVIALTITFDRGTGIWVSSSPESRREINRLVAAFHPTGMRVTVWRMAK